MLESKKVKISLVFLKFLSYKIEIISQLIVLFGNGEEILATN